MSVARATGAPVVCMFELGLYLTDKGLQNVRDMGIGGTQEVAGVPITMTQAVHSGSIDDGGRIVYLGGAAGFVLRAPGMPTIYFAGDTGLFGDMKMIGEIYQPRDRVPADRRSLHDGTRHRRDRRAAGSACVRSCRCTGARFRC